MNRLVPFADRFLPPVLILQALAATLSIAASQILLGVALLLGVAAWLGGRRPVRTGLELPAALLVGWALLMIPFSSDAAQSLVFARRFYLLCAIWLYAGWGGCRAASRGVPAALALGGYLLGSLGLWQVMQKGGPAYLQSGQLVGRASLFQGYMTGGGLLMELGLVVLAFVMAPRLVARLDEGQPRLSGRRREIALRLLLMIPLLAILLGLLSTLTRSAWLGWGAGALLILVLSRPRLLPVFALLLAAAILISPPALHTRLLSAFDPGHPDNRDRLTMWRTGWRILCDHPLTGVGDRDLQEICQAYLPPEQADMPTGHLHDNLLMLAAIWGVPGLLLGSAFLFAMPILLLRRWRRLRADPRAPPHLATWSLAGLAVWLGFFVAGFFEWNFGDTEVVLLLYLVAGMGLLRPWAGSSPAHGRREARSIAAHP